MSNRNFEEEKLFVKDMFPHLTKEDIENLFISSNDINIIITKILDGSYKGINLNMKELSIVNFRQKKQEADLYYPELFNNKGVDVSSGDLDRQKTDAIFSRIKNIKNKLNICKDKKVLEYQTEEKQKLYSELEDLNRKRALMILNKSLQKPGMIDLHGLYTKEALMFASDYIKIYNPKQINFITGCSGNSQSLRPSLINFLIGKGYKIFDKDDPYIKGIKINRS
ncbi:SMR domain-containing protein [Vairimorpha necatrix]|uniref:SMR domain-containing protein n=1 Tax=Vairimorpha necatrix TaxID=6039 RepID=A0AAX4J9H0_9MICR